MAVITPTLIPTSAGAEIPERTLLAGLALTSFSALLLELALTRLFSVVLFYHFAFLAISIALLGLGAGGVFAYLLKTRLADTDTRTLAARLCVTNSLVLVVVLEIVLHTRVALQVSWMNFGRLTALYLSAAVPFFLTGLLFAVVFARETRRIPRLYGADLCGGALACLAVVPLLNWVGGPNVILVAGATMAAAGTIWAGSKASRRNAALLALALVALTGVNYSGRLIDIVYAKGMFRDPAWVEFARWNALSRVEVDRQGNQGKAIVIDADASTYIMNADLAHWQGTVWEHNLMAAPPALANVLRPRGEFAIIGPGGGVDVLRAVANGSPSVTGIEINPIIATTIMGERYADYSQHLYQRPDVHIHVTDGRSYLRSTAQHFDVVQMTLVDTWASTAAGAFALSENNLYTVEAFREYFDHLKPDGMIAITRWEFRHPREALRVVAVAMEALHRLGVADPARNFIVASQGLLNEDGIPVVVLAKKTAFTAAEEAAVTAHFAHYPELAPLYLPSQPGSNPFSNLIASNDPYAFARGYAYNVAPVNDNAPFFFFTLKPATNSRRTRVAHGNRLEGEPGGAGPASRIGDFCGRRSGISCTAAGAEGRKGTPVAASAALFHCRGPGLHHGRDCLHPALRAVFGASDVRLDRGDFSADAFEWRGEPVFAAVAATHRSRLGASGAGDRHASSRRILFAQPPGCAGWLHLCKSATGQRSDSDSAGFRDGHAISDGLASAGGDAGA